VSFFLLIFFYLFHLHLFLLKFGSCFYRAELRISVKSVTSFYTSLGE